MASKMSDDGSKKAMKSEDRKSEDTSDNVEDDKFQEIVEGHMQKTRKHFELVKSKSDKAYTILKRGFEFVESKRKNFTEMSKKLKDVHFNDVVKLNVGGEMFATTLETLTKFPNSLFGKMFSGSTKLKQGSDGAYFIDRDGIQFRSILNFLRREQVSAGMRENASELIVEAKFFGLESLVKLLSIPKEEKAGEDEVLDVEETFIEDDKDVMTIEEHAQQSREALDEAQSQLKDGHFSLKKDLSFLEEKRGNFLEMAKRLRNVHFADVIKLKVGGKIFETSITTLQNDPDSMLAAMFSKRFEPLKQKDGAYFIDRDGTHFRHVLNYLRMGEIPRDVSETVGSELLKEAEFYNLNGLIDCILRNTTIKINAGGQIFAICEKILMKDPESVFAKMLERDGGDVPKLDDAYFFDYQSNAMKELLAFLKDGFLTKADDPKSLQGVVSDACFFGVSSLFRYLDPIYDAPFSESSIISDHLEWRMQLLIWVKEKKMNSSPKRIYSAEADGWTATKFHELCDGKGATLVLIESEHGCIFGGYTELSWGIGTTKVDANSFLFSLLSKEWKTPVIMPSNSGGITASSSCGPVFYYNPIGSSLYVVNEPNENPCTYTYRPGFQVPASVPKTNTFLAGAEKFLIKKLEVFAM